MMIKKIENKTVLKTPTLKDLELYNMVKKRIGDLNTHGTILNVIKTLNKLDVSYCISFLRCLNHLMKKHLKNNHYKKAKRYQNVIILIYSTVKTEEINTIDALINHFN